MEGTRNNFQRMGKRIKSPTAKHIPQDILEDILVNLPVKSLLRFKGVSKQWNFLISSKQFTKEHLKKSSDLVRHNLIYTSWDRTSRSRRPRSCSLKSVFDEQSYKIYSMVKTSYHDIFLPNSGLLEDIVGSCNGLILITSKIAPRWYDLILWNPSTRQVKIIPPPLYARRKHYHSSHRFVYGLGYDDSTNDYKVVSIFVSKTGPHKTQMYSLRTNSWKKIGNFEKGYLWSYYPGTHVNGKLHWFVEERCVGGNQIIVSLSLVDGKYDTVAPPLFTEYNRDSYYRYSLHDLGGYLCLMRKDFIFIDVWVMMKYGEVESWTNFSNLSAMRRFYVSMSQPIWLTKNGDVVVAVSDSTRSRIRMYDGLKFREYVVDDEIPQRNNIYVESLVSPFGD